MYVKEGCRIKLLSVRYLQRGVFIGVCAAIDSELVIPCDVNRGYELWSGARGCRPVLDLSCVTAHACAGFGWVIFPDTVHSALGLSLWPGLALWFRGFESLWLASVMVFAHLAFGCAGLYRPRTLCCGLSDITCDSLRKFDKNPHLSYGLLKVY